MGLQNHWMLCFSKASCSVMTNGGQLLLLIHAVSGSNKLLGIRMHIMCLTRSMWKVQKWRCSKHCRDDTVLSSAYPAHGSASEVNQLGPDAQVVSCCLHPFVEQLTISIHLDSFWCSLLSVSSKSSTSIAMAS